jgi:hypothetical protein
MTLLRVLPQSLGVLFAPALFAACVDTAPGEFVETPSDAGLAEGSVPDGLLASCRQCITADGGPCRAVLDACDALEKCRALTECLLDIGCFSQATLEIRIECGMPCLEKLGISAGTDPAITGVLQVNACSLDGCRSACLLE